ncbi:MAG: FAD-dependent oxidoreductase [Burkholderiales bacterium]|nr:FAD-dependent oxidoreductase [Nitrosomonadaceae bacterium]
MTKRLLLIGGGHAHVHVLDVLARRILTDAKDHDALEVTLVSPHAEQVYSGMLPGWIAGHYALDACCIPLSPLAARAGARLVARHVVAIDPVARIATCDNGEVLPYNVASVDIGSAANDGGIRGAREFAIGIRPWPNFVAAIDRWKKECVARTHEGRQTVVVGGGAGGIEIVLALAHTASHTNSRQHLTLVSASNSLAAGFARRVLAALKRSGIHVVAGQAATEVTADAVMLADGRRLPSTFTIVSLGAAAHVWLKQSGLPCDAQGYVLTDPTLRVSGQTDLFAVGDCATMAAYPRPKSGVYAVRAGPPLADNLLRQLEGNQLRPYVPQRRALYLIATGRQYAIGSWGPLSWEGEWVWRWKDRIDRAFIEQYARHAR